MTHVRSASALRRSRALLPGLAITLILPPAMALAHAPDPAAELRFYATIVLLMSLCLGMLLMIGATHWSQHLLAIILPLLMPLAMVVMLLVAAERARANKTAPSPTPPGIEAPVEDMR